MRHNLAPIKISIITATFNSERYLEDTLRSVVKQTHPHIEHIIIDGGSRDRTLEIVAKYQGKIKRVISEPDRGVYDAFNKGVLAATGDVLYFLNSDDYFCSNTIVAEVAAEFEKHPEATIVYGKNIFFDELFGVQYVMDQKYERSEYEKGNIPYQPASFIKKELHNKHGLFNLAYKNASDYDFLLKCFGSDGEKAHYLDRVISVFRLGGVSNHPSTRQTTIEDGNLILQKHFGADATILKSGIDWVPQMLSELYRVWIGSLLNGQTLTGELGRRGVKKVAIFGSLHTAMLLIADCRASGIEVVSLLDNNHVMQGTEFKGVMVQSPAWLLESHTTVDAVIISNESDASIAAIRSQLENMPISPAAFFSWKELLGNKALRR